MFRNINFKKMAKSECAGCENYVKDGNCIPKQYLDQKKLTEGIVRAECPLKCPIRQEMSQTVNTIKLVTSQ